MDSYTKSACFTTNLREGDLPPKDSSQNVVYIKEEASSIQQPINIKYEHTAEYSPTFAWSDRIKFENADCIDSSSTDKSFIPSISNLELNEEISCDSRPIHTMVSEGECENGTTRNPNCHLLSEPVFIDTGESLIVVKESDADEDAFESAIPDVNENEVSLTEHPIKDIRKVAVTVMQCVMEGDKRSTVASDLLQISSNENNNEQWETSNPSRQLRENHHKRKNRASNSKREPSRYSKTSATHECDYCNAVYAYKSHLEYHVLQHTHEERYECDICSQRFVYKQRLVEHILLHLNKNSFYCKECNKSYSQKGGLKAHMIIHIGEKVFRCKFCNSSFLRKRSLKLHELTHTDYKLFTCAFCDASFQRRSHIQSHVTTHMGLKRYACKLCDRKFRESSYLKQHMLTHTGVKRFSCEKCEKSFCSKQSLSNHYLGHAGIKPFSCNLCTMSFIQGSNLNAHLLRHSGEKSFQCRNCPKTFLFKSGLEYHELVHKGKKDFVCEHCNKSWMYKSGLKKHIFESCRKFRAFILGDLFC